MVEVVIRLISDFLISTRVDWSKDNKGSYVSHVVRRDCLKVGKEVGCEVTDEDVELSTPKKTVLRKDGVPRLQKKDIFPI